MCVVEWRYSMSIYQEMEAQCNILAIDTTLGGVVTCLAIIWHVDTLDDLIIQTCAAIIITHIYHHRIGSST
jgi:hypothetical protein